MTKLLIDRALLEQALETLEALSGAENIIWVQKRAEIEVEHLRAALAQEEQEPYILQGDALVMKRPERQESRQETMPMGTAIYTTPPRREWKGLSEGEIKAAVGASEEFWASSALWIKSVARAIEQALKERNE